MRTIDFVPKIVDDMFVVRILMDDYDIQKPVVFSITARRNDGTYLTENLTYPDPDFDYEGNVRVDFFGMSKPHFAQVINVKVNGEEIKNYYTPTEAIENTQSRYDDSIIRYNDNINLNHIELDFVVLNTGDPKLLQIADTSAWGAISERRAIIDITIPGKEESVTFYLAKNMINTFTSPVLGLNCETQGSCGVEYLDLPDGIYDISITGSPSKYRVSHKYLKTDRIRLDIDKLWVKASILCDNRDDDLLEKIEEIEYCLASAHANVRLGNTREAHDLIDKANQIIDIANNCVNC